MRIKSIFFLLAVLVAGIMATGPGTIAAADTQLAEATFYVS